MTVIIIFKSLCFDVGYKSNLILLYKFSIFARFVIKKSESPAQRNQNDDDKVNRALCTQNDDDDDVVDLL